MDSKIQFIIVEMNIISGKILARAALYNTPKGGVPENENR